ncbi:MAG TPA: PepSY-like domain-containing protein [Chitinophagales bacterium]|nr:PepSY-like domain-containing protein [Chitinophagales bacterium]
MKNKFMLWAVGLLISAGLSAQKINNDKVPAAVMSAFKAKFPAVTNATWELESKTEYEASFKLNGTEVSANFDNTGKWLETETEIKIADLPAAILATLLKDFAGYKVEEAAKIESVKTGSCYEAELKKDNETFDALFAADGKLLSKTKEGHEKGKKD